MADEHEARKHFAFVIEVSVDRRATRKLVRGYVRDAVASWRGQLEPPNKDNGWSGDPLFGLKVRKVSK